MLCGLQEGALRATVRAGQARQGRAMHVIIPKKDNLLLSQWEVKPYCQSSGLALVMLKGGMGRPAAMLARSIVVWRGNTRMGCSQRMLCIKGWVRGQLKSDFSRPGGEGG